MSNISDYLRLTIKPDTDGTAELFAEVTANKFYGHGSAWFDLSSLEDFAIQLGTTYPLVDSSPLKIRGGFWKKKAISPRLEQEHLAIEFYPIDTST